jgi:two-component system sensor histidine kinase ChvG
LPTTDAAAAAAVAPAEREEGDLALRWSGRVSLTRRILAVNIVALLLLAGGFFYLDSYRSRLVDARIGQAAREARLMGEAIATSPAGERKALIVRLARETDSRLRLYDPAGRLVIDSSLLGVRNFHLIDPRSERWGQDVGRFIDAAIDTVAGARRAPRFREHHEGFAWPSVAEARRGGHAAATVWRAPDRTAIITAADPLPDGSGILLTADNQRDITWTVRAERFRLSMVLLSVTLVSVLLSLFLARTIVRPIRRLARAAVRVRLGRAREVVVPRLPSRRDEIGMLARALSDMSLALRARIDSTEAFAADLTHELKNPLASLRSAVEGLERISDPALQARLIGIVRDDVHRLDRLITDISEASRLDAQLSRTKFVPVDVAALLGGLVAQREARGGERGIRLRFDHVGGASATVLGDGTRLERVFANLLDNAVSFSPDGGTVSVNATREPRGDGGELVVRIDDEGPGVPVEQREAVFRRFHSLRPSAEAFGQHSGLGLAIARTIVEGHQGTVMIESREDRMSGARFVVRLPLAGQG